VERLEEGNAYLRCAWQNSRLVGFDSRNVGSYIYADKTAPGEFILEDLDEEADRVTTIENGNPETENAAYDLSGRKISDGYKGIVIKQMPNSRVIKVMNP